LFDQNEAISFQQTCYPTSSELNKTHFNRTIQESLINRKDFKFKQATLNNLEKILDFIDSKLNN
ncbi:MAG: hypothetical protein RLZZ367_1944, partial [Bacteroidota bacterium]